MWREPVSDDVFSDALSDIVYVIFVHFKHIGAIKHEQSVALTGINAYFANG